jgi:hypothetical protein
VRSRISSIRAQGPQHRTATKAPLLAAAALPWPQVVHEAHS